MKAAIVVVGNELLSGHTKDANGPYLASMLRENGHRVVRILIVPDDEDEIVDALNDARRRAGLVLVCGGLGPTGDDVTIDAVARFLERPLRVPTEAKEQIRRIYRHGNRVGLLESDEVDESAWRMARIPEGGTVVPNDVGAAPGSLHEVEDALVFVLPGPPQELRSVVDHILAAGLLPKGEIMARCEVLLDTFEAPVSEDLLAIAKEHPRVDVGSYPRGGERRVLVRLTGMEGDVEAARRALVERLDDLVVEEGEGG